MFTVEPAPTYAKSSSAVQDFYCTHVSGFKLKAEVEWVQAVDELFVDLFFLTPCCEELIFTQLFTATCRGCARTFELPKDFEFMVEWRSWLGAQPVAVVDRSNYLDNWASFWAINPLEAALLPADVSESIASAMYHELMAMDELKYTAAVKAGLPGLLAP